MGSRSSLKHKQLLFVAVLCAVSVLGSCQTYDHFTLAFQWPFAHCHDKDISCKDQLIKDLEGFNYFTIHGLWPSKEKSANPENCAKTPIVTDDILTKLKDPLMTYWPRLYSPLNFDYSKDFWKTQWLKHGTCSKDKFGPEAYLEKALELGKAHSAPILKAFADAKITPDATKTYRSNNVLAAVKKATDGKRGVIKCTTDKNGKLVLSEVHVCFDVDAKEFRDCAKPSTCTDAFFFPNSPKPPTLSAASSIWEDVAEAVAL